MQRILRLLGIERHQRIDIVQRIEQEMGVELAFEVLQFRLRAFLFDFLLFPLDTIPAPCHFNSHAQPGNQQHRHGVTEHEKEIKLRTWTGAGRGWNPHDINPVEFMPTMQSNCQQYN